MSIRVTVGVNRKGRKDAFIEHIFALVPMPSSFRADRRFWGGVLLAFLIVGLSACGPSRKKKSATSETKSTEKQAGDPNSTRYELKVHWIDINASYVITINGFPALQEYVQAQSVDNKFDVQLNAGLVGKGNTVEIRLEPLLTRSGENLSIGTIDLEAQVLAPGRNQIAGAEVTETQVDSAYKAWSERAVGRVFKVGKTVVEEESGSEREDHVEEGRGPGFDAGMGRATSPRCEHDLRQRGGAGFQSYFRGGTKA
jgi:hypothetical protein